MMTERKEDRKSRPSFIWTLAFNGLFLAIISGALHSLCGVVVKEMKNIHPGQISLYRFLGVFAFSFPGTVQCRESLIGPKNLRFLLFLRGICGSTGVFFAFLSYRYLPLGEVTVIYFCSPVFVTVLARIFLKEPCGVFQIAIVIVTIIGIMLVAKVPVLLSGSTVTRSSDYVFGMLAASGSLLFSTTRFLFLRKLNSIHSSVVLFAYGCTAIPMTVVLTGLFADFRLHFCGLQPILILVFGLASYFAQLLLTIAMQNETAGPVATVRSATEVIFAFLWQVVLFQESSDEFVIAGAVLVFFCVMVISFRKWVLSLPEDSKLKHYFRWMKV